MTLDVRPLGTTFRVKCNTFQFSTGAPFTLAGTPSMSVYEDDNETQITAGLTLTVGYDSITGLHEIEVAPTSGNGYEAGKEYSLHIAAGTVDSVSAVGVEVYRWRVETAQELAERTLRETVFAAGTLTTQTGVTDNTEVNLTGIVDADSQDDLFNGWMGILRDETDRQLYVVRITDFANTNLKASISALDAGVTLPTPASGDAFWLLGPDPQYGGGANLTEAGGTGDHLTALATQASVDAVPTAAQIQAELEENGASVLDTLQDRLTSARAAALDEVTAARMGALTDWINGGRLDLLLDAIKAITDQLGAAQSELAAMPAANATPLEKINFVFTFLRNKRTNDGSVEQLFKDDASTVLGEAAVSEAAGTVTRAEMAAP